MLLYKKLLLFCALCKATNALCDSAKVHFDMQWKAPFETYSDYINVNDLPLDVTFPNNTVRKVTLAHKVHYM